MSVFIYTNIFIYAIAKKHRYKHICEGLLSKINDGEIIGFTSSTAINELFHTVLVGEVKKKYGGNDIVHFIKEHPNVISECSVAYSVLDDIFNSRMVIMPLTLEVLKYSKTFSKKYNLLFSDAIHARPALKIIADLKRKAKIVKWYDRQQKEFFGVAAKKIEEKEKLREVGFIALDLDDLVKVMK